MIDHRVDTSIPVRHISSNLLGQIPDVTHLWKERKLKSALVADGIECQIGMMQKP